MTEELWENVTAPFQVENDEERYIRRVDETCFVSALYRLTGFGYYEWETAIVVDNPVAEGVRRTYKDRDCWIIGGDRRDELGNMSKDELLKWYDANIEGNKNSFETMLNNIQQVIS